MKYVGLFFFCTVCLYIAPILLYEKNWIEGLVNFFKTCQLAEHLFDRVDGIKQIYKRAHGKI